MLNRIPDIRVVDCLRDLKQVEPEWMDLFEEAEHPHLANSHAYAHAAAERFAESDWSTYLAYSNNALAGALFGRVSSLHGLLNIPVYRVGTEFVGDVLRRNDPQGTIIESLLRTIFGTNRCPIIEFGTVTEPFFKHLSRVLTDRGFVFRSSYRGYGYTWDAKITAQQMYQRLSGSRRYQIRRTRRRLNKDFAVQIRRIATRDVDVNLQYLDRFVAVEASGWKGRSNTAIRNRPGNEAYFRSLVVSAARQGLLRWYVLEADDRSIAINLSLHTGTTFWVPKVAYDEEFAAYSPGLELLHQINLDCIENPDIRLINWISAPEWLDCWKPDRLPYYAVRIFDRTLAGRGLALANLLEASARRHLLRSDLVDQDRRYR